MKASFGTRSTRQIRARPVGRVVGISAKAKDAGTPLDLKAQNSLLRKTLELAEKDTDVLQEQLESGVSVPETEGVPEVFSLEAVMEDYWTPMVDPVPGGLIEKHEGQISPMPAHDGTDCLKWDSYLEPYADHFKYRWSKFREYSDMIEKQGGMEAFTRAYDTFGLNRGEKDGKPGVWYREWAPGARAMGLVGEFNSWEPKEGHWATKGDFGHWALFLPDSADGVPVIPHDTKLKTRVQLENGEWAERIPAWIRMAWQAKDEIQYNGVYYEPLSASEPGVLEAGKSYTFAYPRPTRPRSLRIYECHVGMSSAEKKINSYTEFKTDVIPRIRKAGYNCIQIMAIQEHAYYGSFGYHVTNFFGTSSRCGTPDELKAMIDEAHKYGLYVLMDIVHSHASKNIQDGISNWDGTDHGYFHSGDRGYHWMWDSRCFNYGNFETMRFLMSNTRYWLDELKFDGFRFDGVTSMMYHHHGLQMDFTGDYGEYFGMATDVDAVVYLMLMNKMVHDLFPHAITIGEDVSGMPSFSRPISEGGVGFDYRLNMAIADKWIEVMKLNDDYAWPMGNITHTLTNRRYAEPCVGYAESHDQSLVGDKTVAFWLMDADMYDKMSAPGYGESSMLVERGVALHKLIHFLSMCLGGESYLTFMGNEYGHPEWIDFPRDDSYDPSTGALVPGNGGSYEKCRRRWDLYDMPELRYRFMGDFDRATMHLDKAFGFVGAPHEWVSRKDETDKVIICERGDLVMVFNFHPERSFTDYRIGCKLPGPYKVVLSSDEEVFGGYQNVTKNADAEIFTTEGDFDGRPYSMQVYSPSRTVVVYAPSEFCDKDADSKPFGVPGLGVKGLGPYFEV